MTARGLIECRAMAGPDIIAETILSRRNIINTARGLRPCNWNICANGPAVEGVNVTRRSHPATSPGSSAGICPGGEAGMAQFLHLSCTNVVSYRKSRRKTNLSRLQVPIAIGISRAEVTDLADEWEVNRYDKTVKVARKNCDKFITPTVRVMFSCYFFILWSMTLSSGSLRQSQIMIIVIRLSRIS
jgi:hypothetical protein